MKTARVLYSKMFLITVFVIFILFLWVGGARPGIFLGSKPQEKMLCC